MAFIPFSLFLPILLLSSFFPNSIFPAPLPASPYLSPSILFADYQKMLSSFKIYVYDLPNPFNFTSRPFSLFQTSLISSPFITQNPNEAQLFFVPFSPDLSTRALGRLIRDVRVTKPYWNRTLGADHFFLSPAGVDFSADRNIIELKKNSVQISTFPVTSGNFIPHKDIALPPLNPSTIELPRSAVDNGTAFLGYVKWDGDTESSLVNELLNDPLFFVESDPSDDAGMGVSCKFCLFLYDGKVEWMREAMAAGCVPVVIVSRPIQDLPLIDVLKWSEMAVVLGSGGGTEAIKRVLGGITDRQYERMKSLCVTASKHLAWNVAPQPYDAFHLVMYQLWLRRHTIRYARREQ